MLKIKICGITNAEDAQRACEYGADALGFVFAKSPRMINPENASRITRQIPPFIAKVGVFVDADKAFVIKAIKKCKLDTLQFHGHESDKYCSFFRKYCKIIKAFRIKESSDMESIEKYIHVNAYLFDSYSRDIYGGTGIAFAHGLLKNRNFKRPIIIAGGINEKNCGQIAALLHPFAFDVSSSIESNPGKKDLGKMKNIIKKVKLIKNS